MKKKLLFVMSNLNNGGAERSLVNLLQLIDYSKYEVDLVLFQKVGMFLKQVPKEVNILDVDLNLLFDPDFGKRLSHLKVNRYDIKRILSTFSYQRKYGKSLKYKQYRWKEAYRPIISKLSKRYDVATAYLHCEPIYYLVDCVSADKKIGWVHNEYTKTGLEADFDNEYFKELDSIITISDLCADILKESFPKLSDKVMVLPNLTSSKIVRNLASEGIPQEFGCLDKDKKILVSIGRLQPQKGFDFAIEATRIMKERGMNFKWFILGSGDLEADLNNQIKEANVEDCIELIGSRENPYIYMQNADIVVQPSRFEGKSIVLDEAKILGCPIVATNYTTVRDQLNDSEGKIVEMNPEAIADGIEWMLENTKSFSDYLQKNEYGNEKMIELYYDSFGA